MGKYEKLIVKILRGTSDSNIEFNEILILLKRLGFTERVKGGHHIFFRSNVEEIINIQSNKGKAKAYQVKQIRKLIVNYKLDLNEDS